MSRRASLPGASELFRITSSPALDLPPQPPAPPRPAAEPSGNGNGNGPGNGNGNSSGRKQQHQLAHGGGKAPQGSGRTKHDAKITVYVSGDELVAMEQARLNLRAKHGLVVDRGRLVREAVAVLLGDFDQHGEESVLVRRLRAIGADGGVDGGGEIEGLMDGPASADQAPEPEEQAPEPIPHETVHGGTIPEGMAEELSTSKFKVRLSNFEGPFDLLLQLISQHQLDVTEVALHQVTDDFIAYTRALGPDWNLDETTEFLVIAATLLDLKAARLLPAAEVENEDDLALLEVRDLLFARVLQYRAYKQVAALFGELEQGALRRYPRSVALEERFVGLLPEVMLGVTPEKFAEIAVAVFRPKPPPTVSLAHLHMGHVSVREHAALLRVRLADKGSATFSELVADCEHTVEIVARFLALLELYREATVQFEQTEALAELHVRWTGGSTAEAALAAEHDRTAAQDEEYG